MAFYSTKSKKKFNDILTELNLNPFGKALYFNSNCKHINNMIKYFQKNYSKLGFKEIEIIKSKYEEEIYEFIENRLLEGLNYTKDFIKMPQNWIRFVDLANFIYNAHNLFPKLTIYEWVNVGKFIMDDSTVLLMKILATTLSIKKLFKRIQKYNNLNNDYTFLEMKNIIKNKAIFNFYYNNDCNIISPGVAPHYFIGILILIPIINGFTYSSYKMIYNQMKLENIVNMIYRFLKPDLHFKNSGDLYFKDILIARKIHISSYLDDFEIKDYYEKNKLYEKNNYYIYKVENDLIVNKIVYLKKDELFNFPFSRFEINWGKRKYFQFIKKIIDMKFGSNDINTFYEYLRNEKKLFFSFINIYNEKINDILSFNNLKNMTIKEIRVMFHNLNNMVTSVDSLNQLSKFKISKLKNEIKNNKDYDLNLFNDKIKREFEEIEELISKIHDRIDIFNKIIKINYHRIIEKNQSNDKKLEVNEFLKKEIKYIEFSEIFKDIKFELNIEKKKYFINIPYADLSQYLYELINNASKALINNEIKKIEIKSYLKGEYVVIDVKDNGYGISENDIYKIFLGKKIRKERKGDNLGLIGIKSGIERYNGYIEVESYENKWTSFRLFIPLYNKD